MARAFDHLRSLFSGSSRAPSLDEVIKLPAHVLYVHWAFDAPLASIEWDLSIETDPGTSCGEYLSLYNAAIDGSQFYLGLQTNMRNPELDRGVGKGLIFSTWWSFDEADTRVADGGFRELGTHEGTFIGVRRGYDWGTGDYRVTLARGDAETTGRTGFDWFDLSITSLGPEADGSPRPVADGPAEWIGSLRFPRRRPERPATIEPTGVAFLEVYGDARTWADVPTWAVDVMAYGDGTRCRGGRTEYPRYPHGQRMPNTNARFDAARDRVHLAMGSGVEMSDAPRPWR